MNWTQLMCADRIRHSNKKALSSDLRTEFEKDYHRIISSPSFRRLQDKTQVFPLDKNDFVRTRLTHSLEVSSFAKSLGQSVGARIIKEGLADDFSDQTRADICDVLQCAGLLHDIGNPAFGHFGESAIQDWFKKNMGSLSYSGKPLTEILDERMQNDFYCFEGNTQALRVVTKLHFLVDERGMNLTKALLATMIKYPGSSLEISYDKKDPDRDIKHKKMGYFLADEDNFKDIESSCGLNGCRHPLTFLLEAADDIAYNTADIEDAVKKGMITYEGLKEELIKIRDSRGGQAGEAALKAYSDMLDQLDKYYKRAKENDYEPAGNYAVSNWNVTLQGMLINAVTDAFVDNYDDIMSGKCKRDLISLSRGSLMVEALSDIAYRYVFISRPILKLEVAASAIFDFLLDKFTDAFIYYDTPLWSKERTAIREKLSMLMSDNYLRIYRKYSGEADEVFKLYLRLLMVTDYVCGMTDSYAKMTYQELMGIL